MRAAAMAEISFTCFGTASSATASTAIRLPSSISVRVAARLAPDLPPGNFRVGEIDRLPWDDGGVDAVICSAVLHFASDLAHFDRMLEELWRVLAPEGVFFARLASNIGIEGIVGSAGRRSYLPDGSERFLVDEAILLERTRRLGGQLLDPLKTTNVQQQRCMTTWCIKKPGS